MKTNEKIEKKEFRKLTDEELEQVTGGVSYGKIQCTDGIWVRSAKDCPAMK